MDFPPPAMPRRPLLSSRLFALAALALALGACDGSDPLPDRFEVPVDSTRFLNSVGMSFRRVPAGTFMMGAAQGQADEQPPHPVTLTRPFFIGTHEVTQRQWQALMGENPSAFPSHDSPVEQISWHDAQRFIAALNVREGTDRYRLPTEAEWEYAARAGSPAAFSYGDDPATLEAFAWFSFNASGRTHSVGRKRPNAFGLADVHGNVWEWVQDTYDPNYYRRRTEEDPTGPPASLGPRVIRGGGWASIEMDLRLANRGFARPDFRSPFLGFRLVRMTE